MEELKEGEQALCQKISWQFYLNLMGQSNETVELRGKAMDETDVEFTTLSHAMFVLTKVNAYSLFGEYELGARMALKRADKQVLSLKGGSFR
eukprot:15338402-Ditylum_brightwellii.AAC.1